MKLLIAIALAVGIATPAHAEWRVAESDHFVIYADDSEKTVRRFSEMLERYHSALEATTGRRLGVPSPSNRVTIYAVGSARDVQKLANTRSRALGGFYIPRAGGSVAFVQDMRSTRGEPDQAMTILLHEYAHHFFLSSQRLAMPRWMSEGAAEFFASAGFEKDGSVKVGRPSDGRTLEIAYAAKVPIRHLLDEKLYAQSAGRRYDAFYGRSWLLYHYLTFEPKRKGQLLAYWQGASQGASRLEAAEQAFGDLDELERDLELYVRQRRMPMVVVPSTIVRTGTISVSTLSPGHAEMLPIIITSKRGVDEEEAKALLGEARAIAAKHGQDAAVLAALAEAEYDAGNHAESIAAADRAIAIDPTAKNAFVQKGLAMFALAPNADDPDAAYSAAMKPFQALNKLENDHPYPLIYFYRSYSERGREPSENARHALQRAAELAPFDQGLAWEAGQMLAQEGRVADAIFHLAPLAGNPHGGRAAAHANALIAFLGNKPDGTPVNLAEFVPPLAVDEPEDEQTGS